MVRRLGHVPGLSEREKYLFDVQGWVVFPRVLQPRLLRALNDALDANQARFGEEDEDLVEESSTPGRGAPQTNVPRDAGVASPALRPVPAADRFPAADRLS